MKVKPQFCICGKLCTSAVGLILHQRRCQDALNAVKSGKSATRESDIIIPHDNLEPDLKEFLSLSEEIAFDAHLAYSEGNKSAGRRARTKMIELRKMITPLRSNILDSIKEKK